MRSLPALIAALVLALPVPVAAEEPASSGLQNPEAIEHFKRAQAHFDAENYAKAVPELKAAYSIEPTPRLLYAWAQAERFAGNCRKAVPLYERYLATGPDEESRGVAQANIIECAAEQEAAEEPDPKPEPGPDKDAPKPPSRDWLAPTFIGLGVATGIAGGVLLGIGSQEVADAPGAPTEDDYFDELDAGRQKHTAGIALVSVGGALILAGVIRYAVLVAKYRKQGKPETSLRGPAGRFSLGLQVRF